jgi:tetratricopeptide (TPR) repeat protein
VLLIGVASQLKRFDVAEREANALMERGYRPSRMQLTLGGLAQMQGQRDRAAQHYREALRLEPGLTAAAEALRQVR